MIIVLERAKSSILPNGNFQEFFLGRGYLRFKREFSVTLIFRMRLNNVRAYRPMVRRCGAGKPAVTMEYLVELDRSTLSPDK